MLRRVNSDTAHQEEPFWSRPDGLKRFRGLLREATGRTWSPEDVEKLYERVQMASTKHERKPISSGDLLRLLWNSRHECAKCGRRPPEVVLHVDHRFPASRGGSSKFENLQLLCAEHNLSKSDKLEEEELWLDSV